MLIYVKVQTAAARAEIAGLQKQIAGLRAQSASAATSAGRIGATENLTKFGSRLQWAGRQLTYNFTLPLALAIGMATKWELANEKAFTNIAKVYGDINAPAAVMNAELQALDKSFEALSNKYGVQRAEVLNVAAAWAQAGVSGVALAKSVDLTLQAMILGEMDSTKATQALISIQAQYGASTSELNTILAELNIVENQTGISMAGLIDGFQRAAGVARTVGVSSRELAALLAALTPAAGSAAQAGNALKTIFSRIVAPTKQASDVLKLMGINVSDLAWKTANGSERLKIMAVHFQGLSNDQQAFVSSVVASRYQINRFNVLMRELAPGATGFYQKALQATSSQLDEFKQKQKELNQVLDSNPQKLKQIGVILQNSLADIVQPLIPLILGLAAAITSAVKWFGNLDPRVQRIVGLFLLFIAATGPIIRYMGAVILLFGELLTGLKAVAPYLIKLGGLLLAPFVAMAKGMWTVLRFFADVFLSGLARSIAFVGSTIAEIGGLIVTGLTALMTALVTWLGATLSAAFAASEAIGTGLLELTAGAAAAVPVLWGGMAAATEGIFVGLAAFIGTIWTGLIAFLTSPGLLIGKIGALFAAVGGLVAEGIGAVVGALVSLPGLIIAAIVGVIVLFHTQIQQVLNNLISYFTTLPSSIASNFNPIINFFRDAVDFIKRAFYSLPNAVQNAFRQVLQVVEAAAKGVYQLFSYLNPFAHHSPSLVENSQKGMAAVADHHKTASEQIQQHIGAAHDATSAFGQATAGFHASQDAVQSASDRKQIAAVDPGALASYDRMEKILKVLKVDLDAVNNAVQKQQAVVDGLKTKLDAANDALQTQQDKLTVLQKIQSDWSDKLNAAKSQLSDWANTPIQGMKAMGDAIFANDQAQKALQLQLLQMKDAGNGIDDITAKLATLNGQQELLKGQQADLRNAGAGSDITGAIQTQVTALDTQKKALQDQLAPLAALQTQLDKLATEGQILDLQNSLEFDPLKKQIDDAANSMKEMPFDQILAGVQSSAAAVATLTTSYDAATKAVDAQQAVVDKLAAARDLIQAKYDAESKKLQTLKDQYDAINNSIQDITSSIDSMLSAAQKASSGKGLGATAKQFAGGAGANLPDVGGTGSAIRTDWKSQVPDINSFTSGIADDVKKMFGKFDLFKPIRDKWNELTNWWTSTINPMASTIGGGVVAAFSGVNWGAAFDPIRKWWDGTWKGIQEIAGTIWTMIGQPVIDIIKRLWQGIIDVAQPIINEVKTWGDLWGPFIEATNNVWKFIGPTIRIIGLVLLGLGKIIFQILANVIGPVFSAIGQVIGGALRLIHGAIKLILDIISGNWGQVWQDILDIFTGTWEAIWGVLSNAVKVVWGIIAGFVQGIVGFFQWVYDQIVGHSIIPDLVNGIIFWFQLMWTVVQAIWNVFMAVINVVAGVVMWFWNSIIAPAFAGIAAVFRGAWIVIQAVWAAWQIEYNIIAALVMWFWNTIIVPVWNAIVKVFQWAWGIIGTIFAVWRAEFNLVWTVVRTVAGLIWDKIQALASFFSSIWTKYISPFVQNLRQGFQDIWQKVVDIYTNITGKFTDMVTFFKGLPAKIGSAVVGMWDGIKNSFKNVINTIIGWWNNLHFSVPKIDIGPIHIGGQTIDFPDLPLLARGGLAKSASIAGEGRYPEFVIPTDPAFRQRALTLLNSATATLYRSGAVSTATATRTGAGGRPGGTDGAGTVAVMDRSTTNITFQGNLVFPNVKHESDAEAFITNLKTLAKGA